MKKKNANVYFVLMAIVAFVLFFVGYSTISGEVDWFYHHKLAGWAMTIALFAIFSGMLYYYATHSKKSQ